ncbi:DUF4371 domain-containing protein [Trichonephila clavipes]|nr:DUF4371 domain-containing protein [Trichonephila clavipes]
MLHCNLVQNLLNCINPIRKLLQTEDNDLPSAMEFLKNRKDFFKDLNLDTALNEMLCDAREFADEIDISANFELTQPRHRVRRRNVNFDYEAREDLIEDPTLKYKPTASSAALQAQVAPSLGDAVYPQTIRRRLAEGHLGSRHPLPLRVLPLTPTHRRLRLEW